MWVTCYTDASFGKSGARWAVWLRSEQGRIVQSGHCPSFVTTSTNAELAAIVIGMRLAVTEWGPQVAVIDVRSDCVAAMALASGSGRARCLAAKRLQLAAREMVRRHRLELRCRWVKAHQDPGASRAAYINDYCDQLARTHGRPPRPRRRAPRRHPSG
jgi:ribonuclease HI